MFVLVTDRKRSRSKLDYSAAVAKVFLSEDRQLAVAMSGSDLAKNLGRRIVNLWESKQWPERVELALEEVGNEEFTKYYSSHIRERPIEEQPRSQLLIFDAKAWQLYELHSCGKSRCETYQSGYIPIGHSENLALFFSERFLGIGNDNERIASMSTLKRLAAFTVLTAARLNPTGIGYGFDLFTFDSKRAIAEQVSTEERSSLKNAVKQLDQQMDSLIFQNDSSSAIDQT